MVGQLIAAALVTTLTGLVVTLVSLHPAAKLQGCSLAGCGLAILVVGLLLFMLGVGLATDRDRLVALALAPIIGGVLVLAIIAIVRWPGILLSLVLGLVDGAD